MIKFKSINKEDVIIILDTDKVVKFPHGKKLEKKQFLCSYPTQFNTRHILKYSDPFSYVNLQRIFKYMENLSVCGGQKKMTMEKMMYGTDKILMQMATLYRNAVLDGVDDKILQTYYDVSAFIDGANVAFWDKTNTAFDLMDYKFLDRNREFEHRLKRCIMVWGNGVGSAVAWNYAQHHGHRLPAEDNYINIYIKKSLLGVIKGLCDS